MKKIININLSGRVIPIEDSAYEKLQAYIESLRRYFANEESREEIINDIESRIAELLHEKIRKGAETTTDADIEEIIASMGTVEDFEAADKENLASSSAASSTGQGQQQQQQYAYTEKKPRGRLYRDSNDKFIGGVCSGIANYLNIDPAIVRILFAIITFGGFGLGILIYIILWIVLPPKDLETSLGKRLYRNPDNRIIGGVAGGLAAYFNRSVSTIRLIFAAPLILSIVFSIFRGITHDFDMDFAWNIGFGSLTVTFILIYIILWIVLPEADSEYQKMEMRGEKVDVNRIRQNVKEGMSNMKERVKDWGNEVKSSAQNMASDIRESGRSAGRGIGHAIGEIFKVFFLFIAGSIAFALFVGLIALVFGGVAWWPVNNFLWTSNTQQLLAWGTLIFFLVVPLIGFVTWIIRRIMRARSRSNYLGWTFGGLWAIGWVMGTLFIISIMKDFRQYEHVDTPVTITQPSNQKMIVAVSEPALEYSGGFGWMNDESDGWDISSDTLKIGAIKLRVIASPDSQYHVTMKKYSFGRTREGAENRAEKIQYSVVSKDSVLDLANGYAIDRESKFRVQNIELEIQVPIGKKIRIDRSVTRKLNSMHIKVERKYKRNKLSEVNFSNDTYDFPYKTDVDYTMSAGGVLVGPDGKTEPTEPDYDYRYEKNNDSIELQKRIDEKRKEIEELEKRKIRQQGSNTGAKKKSQPNEEGDVAASPSSFSLVQYF